MSLLQFVIFHTFFLLNLLLSCFFFNDTATTEIYTLSLHDALPISTPHRPTSSGSSAKGQDRSPWKMWPPGRPSSDSRSTGVFASRQGLPSASFSRQSWIGSARTMLID